MTPERWQRIKLLLQSALEHQPHERSSFLDAECAGDEELRNEVESLLASHHQATAFMEAPAFELMAESLRDVDSIVGRQFGRYRITERLGAGGMGEVYLAEDTRLGRKVALKILLAHYTADEERVRRFQREARAASGLNHPNILTIHEVGETGERHFIVTELIEGSTLRGYLANNPISFSDALDIAIQIASALAAAHAASIVHRDIKPENVMVRSDGIVKVLDFGLAKLTELDSAELSRDQSVNTQQGMVMGTSRYMSPEQARGLQVDGRTDIWSLGVVVYEMLSGQRPFEGATTSDVIASILQKEPAALSRHKPDIPVELDWIVSKALRKDRDERYQTVRELVSDLKSLRRKVEFEQDLERSTDGGAKTRSVEEARATATTPQTRWRQRSFARTVAIVAVVPLVAGLVIYFLTNRFRETKKTNIVKNFTFTQLTDQPGPEFFPSLSPDGRSVAYASHALGNWDIYLQRVGGRNPINLTKDSPADDSQPAFSPDGERIAFRSERDGGGIYLMGATGESLIRVSDLGYSPSWSPDGKQLIVGTEKIPQPSTRPTTSHLWIIDIDSGQRRLVSEGDALQPTWSPHKLRIAYWSRPPKYGQREAIYTIPVNGGAPVPVTNGATSDLNPVWSPDGKYIYFSSNRGGSVNVWRVAIDENSGQAQGEPEAVTTIGASTAAIHLSFSLDGQRLAYIAQEEIRNLRKVGFDPASAKTTGEAAPVTRGSMQLWFPDVSPDGEWLTAYSMGQQRHVYVLRTDGSELRDLTNDDYRHFWPRWSPDGRQIAFSSRRTGNYEVWVINRDGSGLQQLTQANGAHYSPWSSDGKMIAYSIHLPKNDCVVIDPGQGLNQQQQPLLTLSDATLSFEGWAWSHDGKKLAGIKHLPNGVHSGVGIYDLETKQYDWLTDFGDWPIWLNNDRHLLFVSQGKIFSLDMKTRKYQPVLTVTDQDVDIGSPGLSPDNRVIYFTFVATEADIWVMNLNE